MVASTIQGDYYRTLEGSGGTAVYEEHTTMIYESESRFAFATEAMVPDPRKVMSTHGGAGMVRSEKHIMS